MSTKRVKDMENMSCVANDEPSTSQLSPPSPKKIKIENDEEESPSNQELGYDHPEPEDIKTEVKEEITEEEVILKDEIADEATPSTSSTSTATQTDSSDDIHERKANEAVEKLLAQLQPQKKIVRGVAVSNVTDAHVFQFLITLMRGKGAPKIWRRFKVPSTYTFRQLHVAIQKVMGWKSDQIDYHLHAFKVLNPATGYVDSIVMSEDVHLYGGSKSEDVAKIKDYFTIKNHKGRYEYDFGFGWQHEFVFENAFPPVAGETYPKCLEGAKACPPEDGVVHSDEEYDSDEFDASACF